MEEENLSVYVLFFKQKTAYEMRISDWSSDVCSSDLWSLDLGYERRIGRTGVAGINFFYRDITNLIELVNTGEEGSEGQGTFVYQPRNVGDGKVYGVEFDLSTDLGFVRLPNTGIFGNVSWLDSELSDVFGQRRSNGQSDYVSNIGFNQDIPTLGVAFGATHRKQGAEIGRAHV